MIGDSVREELALTLKTSPVTKTAKPIVQRETPKPMVQIPVIETPVNKPVAPAVVNRPVEREIVRESAAPTISLEKLIAAPVSAVPTLQSPPTAPKPDTAQIIAQPTSPTLVEFRHKNAVVPEWRLQLQNAVRKRQDFRSHSQTDAVTPTIIAPQPMTLATSGATALQPEPAAQNNPHVAENSKLEAALRRIEQSRQTYGIAEEKPKSHLAAVPPPTATPMPPKTFPFVLPEEAAETQVQPKAENFSLKPPVQARTFLIEKKAEKFDTNKLPPLAQATKVSLPSENNSLNFKATESKPIVFAEAVEEFADETPDVLAYAEAETFDQIEEFEEIEDCAPVSLRFNAGLFDLIIGSFLSFILLSPFMLLNGNLFTFQGLLAFLATCAIVMFIYLTTTIGFLGRTFGMRLFALEIVDIEENEYPTFHQAAVNSCVYLFSLALGGLGFLPLLFNSEKRAAHDLLAGTIVVREEV